MQPLEVYFFMEMRCLLQSFHWLRPLGKTSRQVTFMQFFHVIDFNHIYIYGHLQSKCIYTGKQFVDFKVRNIYEI